MRALCTNTPPFPRIQARCRVLTGYLPADLSARNHTSHNVLSVFWAFSELYLVIDNMRPQRLPGTPCIQPFRWLVLDLGQKRRISRAPVPVWLCNWTPNKCSAQRTPAYMEGDGRGAMSSALPETRSRSLRCCHWSVRHISTVFRPSIRGSYYSLFFYRLCGAHDFCISRSRPGDHSL